MEIRELKKLVGQFEWFQHINRQRNHHVPHTRKNREQANRDEKQA